MLVVGCGAGQEDQTAGVTTPATAQTDTPAATTIQPVTTQSIAPVTTASTSSTELAHSGMCEMGQSPALASYDRGTGDIQWTTCSTDLVWREVRGATDDVVYVDETSRQDPIAGQNSGQPVQNLIAIDARTGAELWRVGHDWQRLGWPLGPFTGGGVVVVGVSDEGGDALVGVDARTGVELWRAPAADPELATNITVPSGVICHPACVPPPNEVFSPIANTEKVVVTAGSIGLGGLRGLDRSTGQQLWANDVHQSDLSGIGVSRAATAVAGDTVIVPAGQMLVAVDALTGDELWQAPRLDHPAAADRFVVGYVATSERNAPKLSVLDISTGKTLWTQPGSQSYGELWALGDGAVFVLDGTDGMIGGVVAYEFGSGAVRWRMAFGPTTWGEPQQAIGDMVVSRSRGHHRVVLG